MQTSAQQKRQVRHRRVRSRLNGTSACPRISVFRSGAYCTVQLIDDTLRKTLCTVSDVRVVPAGAPEGATRKVGSAFALGKALAEKAKALGITRAVFDRGGYAYHGRVKAVAEGARAGGLQF